MKFFILSLLSLNSFSPVSSFFSPNFLWRFFFCIHSTVSNTIFLEVLCDLFESSSDEPTAIISRDRWLGTLIASRYIQARLLLSGTSTTRIISLCTKFISSLSSRAHKIRVRIIDETSNTSLAIAFPILFQSWLTHQLVKMRQQVQLNQHQCR